MESKPNKVTDETLMWFGMYKGQKMANVPSWWLFNLYDSGRVFGALKDYIVDNLDSIKSEMKNKLK